MELNPVWLGSISALAGVAISGTIQGWQSRLQFVREKRWQKASERRARLEQIYEVVEEHKEAYTRYFPIALGLCHGKADLTDLSPNQIPWARLQMLVNLYEPGLRPHLAELTRAGAAYGRILGEVVSGSRQRVNPELSQRLVAAHEALHPAYESFLNALIQTSEQLDSTLYLMPSRRSAK